MTVDSRMALEAADLLDKAADRVDTFGWCVGEGWYAHGTLWTLRANPIPPTQRPAWGSTHLFFAAGFEIPYWKTGPASTPPVVAEAMAHLASFLYSRAGDDGRREGPDGYLDVAAQIEAFEASPGMTSDEVAETFRDCAASIRAKYSTPAEKERAA